MSQTQKLYSVHDVKAETYMPPFCVPSKGLAIRAFEDCINSDDHHFGKHPADYTLFEVGTFDTDSGKLTYTDKISIGNGVDFLNPLKPGTNNGQNTSRSTDENSGYSA